MDVLTADFYLYVSIFNLLYLVGPFEMDDQSSRGSTAVNHILHSIWNIELHKKQ